MSKTIVCAGVLALGCALPAVAAAQTAPGGAPCPPGSWFCAEPPAADEPPPPPRPSRQLAPLPDPDDAPPADEAPPPPPPRRRVVPPPAPYSAYPPYPPPPPPPGASYGPPGPPPGLARRIFRPAEWGLGLHAEGAIFGHGDGHAQMGGGGLGLRFKPIPRFGLEANLDLLGGTDYQDDHRSETAFTFNGIFYLNPRSRAQLYLLAGFGWSGAHVTCDSGCSNAPIDAHYTYFGGQAGGGLEIRLGRVVALNADFRGFVRTRIDSQAQSDPEFVDANGRTSNASGGGLFTGGMMFYF